MSTDIIDAGTDSVDMPGEVDDTQVHVSASVNQLINPRTISKKYNQQGRDDLSKTLRKYRGWRDDYSKDLDDTDNELHDIRKQITLLEGDKKKYEQSTLGKFMGLLYSKGIIKNKKGQELVSELTSLNLRLGAYEEAKIRNQRGVATYTKLPKETLGEFHNEELQTPLTVEEKKELLKPEILSALSTQEYIKLWQRLNPYFLGHVTRQGFRDHVGGSNHIGGLKEFHQGFTAVLDDNKQLLPPISVHDGLNPHNRETIQAFIEKEVIPRAENSEDAKNMLHRILWDSLASAPKYAADTSLHFAKEIIADETYGGESGNEVFYVFPSDVIASQYDYAFNWTSDFREKQHEEKWNDIFVWPSNKKSNAIPLDMGVVFLPEDAQVDPNTGSKYTHTTIDGNKALLEVDENKAIVRQVLEIMREKGDADELETQFLSLMSERGFSLWQRLSGDAFQAIDSYIRFTKDGDIQRQEDLINKALNHTGLLWELVDNPISSRIYWESYFRKNPDKKPAHVVYYQGEPTSAVNDFLIENGIKNRGDVSTFADDPLLGLGDNYVESMTEDPRAQPGYENLIQVAHEIIDSHYS